MYTLQRVCINTPRELTFDFWDYKDNVGYEITIITDNMINKHEFAMHYIGRTETITYWDSLIRSIAKATKITYASFRGDCL